MQGAGHKVTCRALTSPCLFVQVGMVACNDYILLESCIYRILQRHFAAAPYYAQLLELFHEVPALRYAGSWWASPCRAHDAMLA